MTRGPSAPSTDRSDADGQPVTDRLLLRTVVGAEPYLAEDVSDRGGVPPRDIRLGAGHVEFQQHGSLSGVESSRLFSSGGTLLAEGVSSNAPDLSAVVQRLIESCESGVLRRIAQQGSPIRFRVADVGEWRWPLRDALSAQLGWVNDPGRWDVNFEVVGGHLVGEVSWLHYSRRIRSLKRQDVSTTPVIAAVLCRLAKLSGTHRVFDPFCGSGTILFDASFWSAAPVVGCDISAEAVAYAAENLARSGGQVFLADAAHSALRSASLDRIVSNLPFGKQVGSHANNTRLYPAFLAEVERLLVPDGRAVLLTEDKRLFREAVEKSNLKLLRERVLESGGARPSAFVLGFRRPKPGAGRTRRTGAAK